MSYSFEDFFDDQIVPEMKKLFSKEGEDTSENFLNILRRATRISDLFSKHLLNIIVDTENNTSVEKVIQKIMQIYDDNVVLRKIEYSEDRTVISVDFQGIGEENGTDNFTNF